MSGGHRSERDGAPDRVRTPSDAPTMERSGSGGRGTAGGGALQRGEVVAGRYRIVQVLGRGGRGIVHEALDLDLGEPVALKPLHAEAASRPGNLREPKREVLLARQITHRNACRPYDLGRDAERHLLFCIMELLAGETLADRLARCGRMSPDEALALAQQLAQGLDAAHAAGVVHRDVKGANILLVPADEGEPERAVITDFDVAHRRAEAAVTVEEQWWEGTPGYMAPEQARGEKAGPAADVYALAAVLLEMVTGRLPFEEAEPVRTLERKLSEDAPSGRELVPELPERWDEALRKCLAREPRERFARAGDVVRALMADAAPDAARPARRRQSLPMETDAFVGRADELAARPAAGTASGRSANPTGSLPPWNPFSETRPWRSRRSGSKACAAATPRGACSG